LKTKIAQLPVHFIVGNYGSPCLQESWACKV